MSVVPFARERAAPSPANEAGDALLARFERAAVSAFAAAGIRRADPRFELLVQALRLGFCETVIRLARRAIADGDFPAAIAALDPATYRTIEENPDPLPCDGAGGEPS